MLDTPDIVWLGVLGMEAALDIMGASYVQPGARPANPARACSFSTMRQTGTRRRCTSIISRPTWRCSPALQVDTTALPQPSVTHAAKARLIKRIGSIESALTRLGDV